MLEDPKPPRRRTSWWKDFVKGCGYGLVILLSTVIGGALLIVLTVVVLRLLL